MQKNSLNISTVAAFILLVILVASQACVSKRLAKQAQKQENVGLYEMAAETYLRSINANPKNIDAATGLRRTGQITLESKADLVTRAYHSGNDKETVYKYLDVVSYQKRIGNTGINLSIPRQAFSYYEEAKPRFLDQSFEEARLLLEEESFSRAESILSEINQIDPSYRDLNQYMRVSQSEPLYREGVEQLHSGFYRKAYYTFNHLLNNQGAYKDAKELREDALNKGRITIVIGDFENRTRQRNVHEILKNKIIAKLSDLNNPFIEIVDDRNVNAFLREQEVAARLGSDMKIGGLIAARALLTGDLTRFDVSEGRMQRAEKRAYLKEVVSHEDKDTGEKTAETLYHKATYNEYQRKNKASGSFRYQLSSTETGTVMVSGVIELSPQDQIHYAVFEGNHQNLVPGQWEYRSRNSPKDKILDERNQVRKLHSLFSARQTIKSGETLRTDLINSIALKVIQDIDSYNPEQ